MAKDNRPVTLVVESAGTCPLIKVGEGFSLRGHDLTNPRGGKMCARAVCSVFPEVEAILTHLAPNNPLPSDHIYCQFEGCGAAFRMQDPNVKEQSGMFTAPFMRRKADRAFLDVADRNAKPQPFLMRLSLDLRDELHFIGKPVKFDDGQPILHQGIDVQQFFILTHGMAGVVTRRDGVETLIGSVGEGEFFGEYPLLAGTPSDYEVRSVGTSTVLSIGRKDFLNLLLKRSALLRIVTRIVAEKVKAASASVENELSRGILGKLSMIPLCDLVQAFNQSRRTGTLVIHHHTMQAFIVFLNGMIISAVAGPSRGAEAFYHVLKWKEGEFCFEPSEPFKPEAEREGAIDIETMALMMEGMRRIDEQSAGKEGVND